MAPLAAGETLASIAKSYAVDVSMMLTTIGWPMGPALPMLAELAQRGLMEGRNLVFETRVGQPEQLPDLARQLVGTHPDVIYATGLEEARAAALEFDWSFWGRPKQHAPSGHPV